MNPLIPHDFVDQTSVFWALPKKKPRPRTCSGANCKRRQSSATEDRLSGGTFVQPGVWWSTHEHLWHTHCTLMYIDVHCILSVIRLTCGVYQYKDTKVLRFSGGAESHTDDQGPHQAGKLLNPRPMETEV